MREDELQVFPLSLLRRYETALKSKLGREYTFKEPILTDGPYTLIYQWFARKRPRELIPSKFVLTVHYNPAVDSFDVTKSLVDGKVADVVWERSVEDVYIDTIDDPKWFLQDVGEPAVEIPGLEGPFTYRDGRTLYYHPSVGLYYDRTRDVYLDPDDIPR